MKLILNLCFLFSISCFSQIETTIRLNGAWRFKTDKTNIGKIENWYNQSFEETIRLPGSMTENGKGENPSISTRWTGDIVDSMWYFAPSMAKYREDGKAKIPYWLTPERHFVGLAWYQKEVTIPKTWLGRNITLHLERVHWKTTVWIDSIEIGSQNSPSTPHRYNLTNRISDGRHKITICVDNRNSENIISVNSNSISDHTQGNWNGIIGNIQLDAQPPVWVENAQYFPDLQSKTIKAILNLKSDFGKQSGNIKISITTKPNIPKATQSTIANLSIPFTITTDSLITAIIPIASKIQTWDEFSPNLYTAKIEIISKNGNKFYYETNIGFRNIVIENGSLKINEIPIFLRGSIENCIFPQTGYPPTEDSRWLRIFQKCKNFGINHIRFQSYCPPEAAFDAADKLGIYLQIDPMLLNKAVSDKNNTLTKQFYNSETDNILNVYGNHPSFCFFSISTNNDFKTKNQLFIDSLISNLKKYDSRRLYWTQNETNQNAINILELGQYATFPNYSEIKKYTGINTATAFEISQEIFNYNGLSVMANDFHTSSGKLQTVCYKMDIESALLTKNINGFLLMSLTDYPGKGYATIGLFDPFWDEKKYVNTLEINSFCNVTVPLIRIAKYTFTNNEPFTVNIEVAHFGNKPIEKVTPKWRIRNANNTVIDSGLLPQTTIPIGNCFSLGKINRPLFSITKASMLQLEVSVGKFSNKWNFWVYPFQLSKIDTMQIYTCNTLNNKAKDILKIGGKVLLMTNENLSVENSVQQNFTPMVWNSCWKPKETSLTTGVVIDTTHLIFKDFPTQFYSNFQWFDILNNQQVMIIDSFPSNFKSIVQPIDSWITNRRLSFLFEAKIDNGKIIVCSSNLYNNNQLAAKQFVWSIKKYMMSDQFQPNQILDIEQIRKLFKK